MSDSLMIEATGEDYDRLRDVFHLAPSRTYAAATVIDGTLRFLQFKGDSGENFPFSLPTDICAAIAREWLEDSKLSYGPKPDIDGSCERGWKVHASNMGDHLTVSPHWMIYHK